MATRIVPTTAAIATGPPNQGNRMLDGEVGSDLYWKIPLTYVVPYVVATVGAPLNTRE